MKERKPLRSEMGWSTTDSITVRGFDLPNDFVLRPKTFSFVLFRCDRHEIGQNNFARVVREDRFENIRLVDVTPGKF